MNNDVTWQPPTAHDACYHMRIESGATTVADLTLTAQDAKRAIESIRDGEGYVPHLNSPWRVEEENGHTTLTIQTVEDHLSLWINLPCDQVHDALKEIVEHSTQEGGDGHGVVQG